MEPKERKERLELCNKLMEKEELLKFQANLKRQLELIRMNSRPPMPPPSSTPTINLQPSPGGPPPGTGMPMPRTMPIPSAPPYDRQNSNSSTSGNDDGWVLVPSQTESDAWLILSMSTYILSHEHQDQHISFIQILALDLDDENKPKGFDLDSSCSMKSIKQHGST